MLRPLSSEDYIEDCASVSSSEGDTIMVGALLDLSRPPSPRYPRPGVGSA
jgi:hypothetical protein